MYETKVSKNQLSGNPVFGFEFGFPHTISDVEAFDIVDQLICVVRKNNLSTREAMSLLRITAEHLLDFPFSEVNPSRG